LTDRFGGEKRLEQPRHVVGTNAGPESRTVTVTTMFVVSTLPKSPGRADRLNRVLQQIHPHLVEFTRYRENAPGGSQVGVQDDLPTHHGPDQFERDSNPSCTEQATF
jgi:hypothetical protein